MSRDACRHNHLKFVSKSFVSNLSKIASIKARIETIKMALALALTLAGFEEDDFRKLTTLFSSDSDRKSLPNDAPRAVSPSARSESSGISSLILSTIGSSYGARSSLSPPSSRSETSEDETPKIPTKSDNLSRALHKKRDILNLAENLIDPSWNMKSPSIPRNDAKSFMANRSVCHRLGAKALEEEYPVRVCRHCGFTEPSPYLF